MLSDENHIYENHIYTGIKFGKNVLLEKDFKKLVIDHLVEDDGYRRRIAKEHYDSARAMDSELLFEFLEATQPREMEKLHAIYNGGSKQKILDVINNAIKSRGLVKCIWGGVSFDSGIELSLAYPRPVANFDQVAMSLYDQNILSVMEEVYYKKGEQKKR